MIHDKNSIEIMLQPYISQDISNCSNSVGFIYSFN